MQATWRAGIRADKSKEKLAKEKLARKNIS